MAITLFISAYLLGNLRFAYLTAQLFNLKPPHSYGSKNPGATNVGRQNKIAGFLTFLLDAAKVCLIYSAGVYLVDESTAIWCGMLTTIGHIYPIDGRGGKGVACWISLLFILSPQMALIYFFTLLLFYQLMKNLGMGSILCVTASAYFYPDSLNSEQMIAWYLLCLIILISHRSNIQQLINSITGKLT
jgi:glycerol-3-phosphate acyltransferase PlsY